MQLLGIAYDSRDDALRQLDLYTPDLPTSCTPPPLICFVHGGAWRSEDKAAHSALARSLVAYTQCAVAVPNYRLTLAPPADHRHPVHAHDILICLSFLLAWHPPGETPLYDPTRLFLVGHSCSAHMLTSIFLNSSSISPSLTPSPSLLHAVACGGIALSEGIYDLDLLLSSFPQYEDWFIAPTFGPRPSYADYSTTHFPLWNSDIRWLVVHSKGDSLVDVAQSHAICNHLRTLYDDAGVHSDTRVVSNLDELDDGHNDILRGPDYVRIIGDFFLALQQITD